MFLFLFIGIVSSVSKDVMNSASSSFVSFRPYLATNLVFTQQLQALLKPHSASPCWRSTWNIVFEENATLRTFEILGRVGVRLAPMEQLESVHVVKLPEDSSSLHHAGHQLLRRQVEQLVECFGMVQG